MRLQKYMAACGVASRRKSEDIILSGRVKVNGVLIQSLGTQVNPEIDHVTLDGKDLSLQTEYYYLAFHKPKGVVTTSDDPQGRKKVLDYFKNFPVRLFTVGRLDYHTSGLILLTNDGNFANKVSHPRHEGEKEYEVKCRGVLSAAKISKLKKGIYIDQRLTSPAKVQLESIEKNTSKLFITITEGRNRQIRRMFDAIGHPVISLKRIRIGPILLGNLATGSYKSIDMESVRYFLDR